jgi:hypothetical protein
VRLSVPFIHRPQIEPAFVERTRPRTPTTATTAMPATATPTPAASHEPGVEQSIGRRHDYELQ